MRSLILVAEFEVRSFWQARHGSYGILIEPIIYLVLLAGGLSGLIDSVVLGTGERVSYVAFVLPGLLMMQSVRALTRMVIRGGLDMRWGTFAIKRLAGVPATSYIAGMCVLSLVIFSVQALLTGAIAWIAFDAIKSPLGLVAAIAIGNVATVFWICVGLVVALRIDNYQKRDLVLSVSFLPIVFTAPVFYSQASAPAAIRWLSYVNPLTYQVTATRQALNANLDLSSTLISFGLALIVALVSAVLIRNAPFITLER